MESGALAELLADTTLRRSLAKQALDVHERFAQQALRQSFCKALAGLQIADHQGIRNGKDG